MSSAVDLLFTQGHGKSNVESSQESSSDEDEPDSTTPMEKETVDFQAGCEVLVKQKDGRYYFGTIVEVDFIREECLVKYGDNTSYFSNFKDLNKLVATEPEDLLCVICKKSSPASENDSRVCDQCGRGYHQKCHEPEIPTYCLKEGQAWTCKRCTESEPYRLRKSDSKQQPKSIRNTESEDAMSSGAKELPYELNSLNWDTYHRTNAEKTYCYCGQNGDWYKQMMQCGRCRQWFHEKCLDCLQYPLYCGDRFYVFVCSLCNHGREFVRRIEIKWVDLVHLMLFNLTVYNCKKYYDLDTTVVPYINDNWHALQLPPKIANVTKSERRDNILSILTNNRNRFKCGREIKKRTTIWGLRVRLPPPKPCMTLPPTSQPITEKELRSLWAGNGRLQLVPGSSPVCVDKHMRSLMMGVAYHQQACAVSETDSPCPSPETVLDIKAEQELLECSNALEEMRKPFGLCEAIYPGAVKKSVPFKKAKAKRKDAIALPLQLTAVIPAGKPLMRPVKRQLSEKDILIGPNGEVKRKRKRFRRSRSALHLQQQQQQQHSVTATKSAAIVPARPDSKDWEAGGSGSGQTSPVSGGGSGSSSVDYVLNGRRLRQRPEKSTEKDKQAAVASSKPSPVKQEPDTTMKDLKSFVNFYFGAASRIAHGERRFNVKAKRIGPMGKMEYLIEWENPANGMT